MKILITGSSGFLGSWACRVLSRKHEVTGLSRESSNLFRLQNIENFNSIKAPIEQWPRKILETQPQVLVLLHWSGVENQFRNSSLQKINIDYFEEICKSAISAKVSKIIGVGSQAELGPINTPISDFQSDNPTTVYGSAKVECRKIGFELCERSDTEFIWGRVMSTYGPLDSPSWLIPSAILTLFKSEKFESTLAEQNWSYLHAFDFTRALIKLIEGNLSQKIFNIGNTSTVKLHDLLDKIEVLLEKKKLIQYGAVNYRNDQVMLLEPKCEGLVDLGWRPIVSLDEGLRQTINWFTNQPEVPLRTILNDLEYFNLPRRT